MRMAFYGSSLVSCYWNGAATYYRGILRALAARGWDIAFHEPDAYDRQAHRDIADPPWARVGVYEATQSGLQRALAETARADVVVKASGVGVFDDELIDGVLSSAPRGALKIYWDVDAPATLAGLAAGESETLRRALPSFDLVLTYGGGPKVVQDFLGFGARRCEIVYNALDPETHFPVAPEDDLACDLGLLANRLPDREARIAEFFMKPARAAPHKTFVLGGSGWRAEDMPGNVRAIGHVPSARHNAFNCSARAVLNVARDSMARVGFSPATRVFEAAGAGACIITDAWEGVDHFFEPGAEILVAHDGAEAAALLADLGPARAKEIGTAARRRALSAHTYDRRGEALDRTLRSLVGPARR